MRDTSTGIELRRVTQQGVEHVSEDGKLYFLTDIQGNGEVRSLLTNDTVLRTQCLCDGLAKLSPVSDHLAMRIPTPGVEGLAKVKVWNITDMGFDGPGSPRKLQRKMTFTEEFNGARDGSGELVFKLPESWPLDVPKSEFQVDAIEFSPCGNFLAVAVGYEVNYVFNVLSICCQVVLCCVALCCAVLYPAPHHLHRHRHPPSHPPPARSTSKTCSRAALSTTGPTPRS